MSAKQEVLTEGLDEALDEIVLLIEKEKRKFEVTHPAFFQLHNATFYLLRASGIIEKHNEIRKRD